MLSGLMLVIQLVLLVMLWQVLFGKVMIVGDVVLLLFCDLGFGIFMLVVSCVLVVVVGISWILELLIVIGVDFDGLVSVQFNLLVIWGVGVLVVMGMFMVG